MVDWNYWLWICNGEFVMCIFNRLFIIWFVLKICKNSDMKYCELIMFFGEEIELCELCVILL